MKKKYQGFTCEFLNEIFEYRDGRLFRKKTLNGKFPAGTEAGKLKHTGYVGLSLMYKDCLVHRIVYLMHHGYVPEIIDHIDGNRANNRIENLRAANWSESNSHSVRKSQCGFRGVSHRKIGKPWRATLIWKGERVFVDHFDDVVEAAKAYDKAAKKFHGKFRIANFPDEFEVGNLPEIPRNWDGHSTEEKWQRIADGRGIQ